MPTAGVKVSAESLACAAPLTTKHAPGSVWNVGAILRSVLKPCAHAAQPRTVRIESCIAGSLYCARARNGNAAAPPTVVTNSLCYPRETRGKRKGNTVSPFEEVTQRL